MTATSEDYFDFYNLVPELRTEVIKYLDIQTLGRFLQTYRSAASHIAKDLWKRKIHEIDPTIWPKLSKRTRKGDSKLLCAILREGSLPFCSCFLARPKYTDETFPMHWLDFILNLQKTFPSVPVQNAFLCFLFTYAKHGSVSSNNKNIGMKCGDVFLTHRRIREFMLSNRAFRKTDFMLRALLHRFARVTYCWSVRWKMDPLFINNKEAFFSLKLYDQDSNLIEFNPEMRLRLTKEPMWGRRVKSKGPLKIDNAKTKFYSIEQIRKNKFKIVLDGAELTPNDLYYFFDYACIDWKNQTCNRALPIPLVIKNWLQEKKDKATSAATLNDAW